MKLNSLSAGLTIALCVALGETCVVAGDWTRFRGPNGTGVTEASSIPVEFGEQNHLLWKIPVAPGNSSPVISQGRIFFQSSTESGGERRIHCIALDDGTELWSQVVAGHPAPIHPKSSYASCSGAADEKRIIMPFWNGDEVSLQAYSIDGKPLWNQSLGKFSSQHGAGLSPILMAGKVILSNDQDGFSEIVALDIETGTFLWKTPRTPTRANYATPLIVERPGAPLEVLIAGTPGVSTYNLQTGTETWKWVWKNNTKQLRSVGSPIVVDGVVIFTGGNGPGDRQVAAVRLEGEGDVSDTHLEWETHKVFPYVPCMLTRDHHIYFINDAGIAGCFVAKTGKQVWTKRLGEATVTASPLMAGDRIYAPAENGTVFVFAASTQFELLATNQLDDSIIASPAAADGKLLIRGKKNLYCFRQ